MKRLFLIPLVLVLMLGLILSGCAKPAPAPTPVASPEPEIPAHFTTYTDELGLFSISYPPDWELALSLIENLEELSKEILDSINSGLSIERAGLIFFAGIPTDEGYVPNMTIAVEPLQYNYTHDEYVEAGIEYTKIAFNDFREFSRIKTTVGGREATIVESEYSFPQVGKLQSMQMVMLVGKTGWVVGCTAPLGEYDAWRDDFNDIVRSLRILK